MDRNIFRYILRYSTRQQLVILTMTAVSFPFLYATLELPKKIINDALAGDAVRDILGYRLTQVDYLFMLCGIFLGLVLINGAFKYVINVYQGIVSERMLRRLRYDLYSRILRFPLPHFRRISAGEIVTMITAEVEAVGGFMTDAFALPAFQGGTLLTILVFMFAQDPIMGFAAISLYPIQMYVIPKLQARVNALGKQRVRQVRRLSERLGETVGGVRDIRANDVSQYERARFSRELGVIFTIRYDIYKKKFFIKFLNNFLAQLGPFFFYSIGGYLVIHGDLTLGALVAVIGAHEKLYAPWKELLTYYQSLWDSQIKFEQVVAQFDPPGIRDEALQSADLEEPLVVEGKLRASNVSVVGDDGETLLDGVGFSVDLPSRIAIVGPAGSGKEELTLVLANLLEPNTGRVLLADQELQRLGEAVTGRQITYVGYPAQLFSGTIADNLFFGLKHRPIRLPDLEGLDAEEHRRHRHEAKRSGNSPHDPFADWIDYDALGLSGPQDLGALAVEALTTVQLDRDVYQMGLRGTIDPDEQPELAELFLAARRTMRERLEEPRLARLVEVFDEQRYNSNASLAENLLFGAPLGEVFDIDHLASHPYVKQILEEAGLVDQLLEVGIKLADTMVELFADLPPDHEYFRQFSFINADDLPEYRALLSRADPAKLDALSQPDRERLMALTFKLVPARHRLGLIDDALQERTLAARRLFREQLPAELEGAVAFFESDRYTAAASLQDNILFGKVAYGQAQAPERISDLIGEVLAELDLRERVIEVGLQAQTGVGASRLSLPQRQKLALARALLKRSEILIVYDPIGPLDQAEQLDVLDNLLQAYEGRTLIWALSRNDWAAKFDHVLVMDRGRVVEHGEYAELTRNGGALQQLVAAA